MQENQLLHGFRVNRVRPVRELDGTLYEMTYERNGASLAYLERDDSNKTFAIGFKTIPEDSTGVFHILEHSVLCGSDKYPVKEPFVELLKGSLNTFLNAMTYNDKTVYPVSSRNDRDFLNLVGIYMDAVFHPRALTDPNIFRQEGWHYEINSPDEDPTYKGVVFNEMKGAYSSVDEVASEYLTNMLYRDTCYAKDSGGDPAVIPSLTYEQFCACHRRYYHPSNARIFLDGKMDLDAVLTLLDEYLSAYGAEKVETDIPMQAPLGHVERREEYEIGEEECAEGKTRLYLGYLFADYTQMERMSAVSLLCNVLCDSNESPLKKGLLEAGLCEDVEMFPYTGIQQASLVISAKNIQGDDPKKVREAVLNILREQIAGGIDREKLTAALNRLEFKARERDFGYPTGLSYALASFDSWLYGGDPLTPLLSEPQFAFLREKLNTRYYEELLEEVIFHSPTDAELVMTPSATLGARKRAAEAERLADIKRSWTPERLGEYVRESQELLAWQKKPDTPEQLATIPALTLDDVRQMPEEIPTSVGRELGQQVILHPLKTGGITYLNLLFDASGLTAKEYSLLSLAARALTNVRTAKRDAAALQNRINTYLGAFSCGVDAYTDAAGGVHPILKVSVSVLDSNLPHVRDILGEVLLESLFDDRQVILNLIRQAKIGVQEGFSYGGHAAAIGRVNAFLTGEGAVTEYAEGYEFYRFLCDAENSYGASAQEIAADLARLLKAVVTRDRLTLSLTGGADAAFRADIIGAFPQTGETVPVCDIQPFGIAREGITVPAQISFAVMGANRRTLGIPLTGALQVARNILSYEYLWNAVRVQGGAYGAGFFSRVNGDTMFYSYRDPNAARSLDCYRESGAFLRQFAASATDLTKFIIGAIGAIDPLLTPRAAGETATVKYLQGRTYEQDCQLRREMLNTTPADIQNIADAVDRVVEVGAVCVVGGKDKLDGCGDKLERILAL